MNVGSCARTWPCVRIWACGWGLWGSGTRVWVQACVFGLAFGFDDVVLVGGHGQARGIGLAFGVAFVLVGAGVELLDPLVWLTGALAKRLSLAQVRRRFRLSGTVPTQVKYFNI